MNEIEQFFADNLSRRAFNDGLWSRGTTAANPYIDPIAKAAWDEGYQTCPECDGLTYVIAESGETPCPECQQRAYIEHKQDLAAGF